MSGFQQQLLQLATHPYQAADPYAWYFARGKLGHDQAFSCVLRDGLIPGDSRVLDLGCGQGLLAAWLLAAQQLADSPDWPVAWPAAPSMKSYHGIELRYRDVQRGRIALSQNAARVSVRFCQADIAEIPLPTADIVVMLDVLHYLDYAAQDALLARISEALSPNGRLLLRVGDAAAGLHYRISTWVDRSVAKLRRQPAGPTHGRSLQQWQQCLQALGFHIHAAPMQGAGFSNALMVAQRGALAYPDTASTHDAFSQQRGLPPHDKRLHH